VRVTGKVDKKTKRVVELAFASTCFAEEAVLAQVATDLLNSARASMEFVFPELDMTFQDTEK